MERLDHDRIAELVEAAKDGELPEAPAPGSQRRGKRMRTVDFSRPTKFGADHQRRMTRAHEAFCLAASTRLSTELRAPVELEVLSTTQLTWTAIHSEIPPRSVLVILEVDPVGTRLLLTIEQAFLAVGLECLLGGSPEPPFQDRRLTEIDWALAAGLVESIITPLSLAWQELGGVSLRVAELGAAEAGHVATVSEPTYGTQLELRINQQSYLAGLLVPWAAIESFERVVSGREVDAGLASDERPLREPLATVPVTVRAEVAHRDMSIRDILGLTPGSIVSFDAAADDGVDVYADGVCIAHAQPGRSGTRRAVQLTALQRDSR